MTTHTDHAYNPIDRRNPASGGCVCGEPWTSHPSPVQLLQRACYFCGKVLSAHAGFIEAIHQPDGLRRDFCSAECLHWQLHEDEKAE